MPMAGCHTRTGELLRLAELPEGRSFSGDWLARIRRRSSVSLSFAKWTRNARMAVLLLSAALTVADGTPTAVAMSAARPTRRADAEENAKTTIATMTMIPPRRVRTSLRRSTGFIVISFST